MKDIKEIIRQEIERLYDGEAPKHDQQCDFNDGYFTGIDVVSKIIDSLPDDFLGAPKIVSGGLEEAAENYIAPIENDEGLDYINFNGRDIKDAFIAGAEWQKNQLSDKIGQLKKEE